MNTAETKVQKQVGNRLKANMILACVSTMNTIQYVDASPKMVFRTDDLTDHVTASSNRQTFIMRWNPKLSPHKTADFECAMMGLQDENIKYDWNIYDYTHVHVGDIFYMLRVGTGNTGIVMRGTIIGEPYKDEDWSGKGRDVRYVSMEPECMIHPNKAKKLLTTQELDVAIPGVNWNEGHSGVLLTSEQAEKLEIVWSEYLSSLGSH